MPPSGASYSSRVWETRQYPRSVSRWLPRFFKCLPSMYGQSIEQAKVALQLAVARLTRDDTFNIIQFNSTMDVLFADAVPADPIHIAKATQYASRLVAQGGTEMQPALQRALDGREQLARLRQVIFLTDGQVGNEDALFKIITSRLGDSRLFTIGIGSAPNSHFMRESAFPMVARPCARAIAG